MSAFITILKRIWSVFRRGRYFEELQQEMNFHVAARAQEYITAGMTSSEAFARAEKEFGNRLRLREERWYDSDRNCGRLYARKAGLSRRPADRAAPRLKTPDPRCGLNP